MRAVLIVGILLTQVLTVFAADQPQFLSLSANKASYVVGDRPILVAQINILPDNPNYEVALVTTYAGNPLDVIPISSSEQVSIAPTVVAAGTFNWVVDAYLQDKKSAAAFLGTISYYNAEIQMFQQILSAETDPAKQAVLQNQITRDQNIVSSAQGELTKIRRKIDSSTLTITATTVLTTIVHANAELTDQPLLLIQADNPGATYTVGSRATFNMSLTTGFEGEEGVQEIVVKPTVDGVLIPVTQPTPLTFAALTAPFQITGVGDHTFSATVSIRSKAQSDWLRDAATKAGSRRASLVTQRDAATDPVLRAYYQSSIDDLTNIINVFYQFLDESLTQLDSQSLIFHVTN